MQGDRRGPEGVLWALSADSPGKHKEGAPGRLMGVGPLEVRSCLSQELCEKRGDNSLPRRGDYSHFGCIIVTSQRFSNRASHQNLLERHDISRLPIGISGSGT